MPVHLERLLSPIFKISKEKILSFKLNAKYYSNMRVLQLLCNPPIHMKTTWSSTWLEVKLEEVKPNEYPLVPGTRRFKGAVGPLTFPFSLVPCLSDAWFSLPYALDVMYYSTLKRNGPSRSWTGAPETMNYNKPSHCKLDISGISLKGHKVNEHKSKVHKVYPIRIISYVKGISNKCPMLRVNNKNYIHM